MPTNNNIKEKIDSTFKVIDTFEEVKITPFFKDRMLRELFIEKEEEQNIWSWFTPSLQLATLVCVVVINIFAYTQITKATYQENTKDFAETYGLSNEYESYLLK